MNTANKPEAADTDEARLPLPAVRCLTKEQAAEYLGEWDFPLNKLLHKALDIYMSRR